MADPFSMAPPKALEAIGKNLSTQYERWQPRVIIYFPATLFVIVLSCYVFHFCGIISPRLDIRFS